MTYLLTSEIADRLRVSRRTVQKLCASGELPCLRVGAIVRVLESDLDEFLNRCHTGDSKAPSGGSPTPPRMAAKLEDLLKLPSSQKPKRSKCATAQRPTRQKNARRPKTARREL